MSDKPLQQRFEFDAERIPESGRETTGMSQTSDPARGTAPYDPPPLLRATERPAPVITDESEFWFPISDEETRARRELRTERWAPLRHTAAWGAGIALVVAAAAALGAHSIVQATGEEVAFPALRRAITVLAQPEALLELHRKELVAAAVDADTPDAIIEVPSYPVFSVALTVDETVDGDLTRMRNALLDRSVTAVYSKGRNAFATGGVTPPVSDRLSTVGTVETLLDGLTVGNYNRWLDWQTKLIALALVLGTIVLVLTRGFSGMLGLGAALLVAGLMVFGAALGLRVVLSLANGEGPLLDEYLSISRELIHIPLRNGLILATAGVALALPAAFLRALFERSVIRESSYDTRNEIEL